MAGPNPINPCLGEQEDEITALSAIFGDDFSKREYEDCSTIYEIKVKVSVVGKKIDLCAWLPVEEEIREATEEGEPEDATGVKKIRFSRSESMQHTCLTLSVSHLVPLRLEFSFPSDYPSCSKPLYTVSCMWLDAAHLNRLCEKLDQLWEGNIGEPVIFPWVEWLRSSSLEYLGADESISLKPYEWDSGMDDPRDPRGIVEFLEPKTCALKILEYNFQIQQQEFRKESHTCEVCFEEKEGIFFHHLEDCGHTFCIECLLDYCQMHVNEGTVKLLRCPEKGCQATLSPIILRQLLSDDDFDRWERLLFQQTLDGMLDVLYCPRCNDAVVQDEDEESKLAQCHMCFFSFCTECQMSWHSTQPCGGEENPSDNGDKKPRKKNCKKKKNQTEESEVPVSSREPKHESASMQNYKFLMLQKRLGNYQRCPKCRIMVERISGCNMMHCSRCATSFCWTCGQKIAGYGHFEKCGVITDDTVRNRGRDMLENRPIPAGALRIQEQQRLNPLMVLRTCPRCRQRNMKEHRNNHMKCWACKTDFCYQCGKQLGNPVQAHFAGSGGCQQHSDD